MFVLNIGENVVNVSDIPRDLLVSLYICLFFTSDITMMCE